MSKENLTKEDVFCIWIKNHQYNLQEEFSLHYKQEFEEYCRRRFEVEECLANIDKKYKWMWSI